MSKYSVVRCPVPGESPPSIEIVNSKDEIFLQAWYKSKIHAMTEVF